MDVNEVQERIEDLYYDYGNYICLYKDDDKTWEQQLEEEHFSKEEIEFIKNKYNFEEEIEIPTQEYATALCDMNGYNLVEWVSDQVFESCGYDLYILSFAINNGPCNNTVYSFHNVHERC